MRPPLALAAAALCWAPAAAADPPADRLLQTAQGLYDGIRQDTLPNGLRVYLKPVPGSPVVSTMMAYRVGSADEELTQTGLSHYLEHLMFKGTDKLLPGDIDRLTQRNGGKNNAYTTEDMTVFHFDFAADRWKTALEIEADRMRHLRIDEKHEFQQEKGAVISELDMYEDQAWDLERKQILPLLFGPSAPYGHPIIGEKQHVREVTADVIKAHYDRWYHPNNAVLVVAGGFDPDDALAAVRKLFGPIPKAELPARLVAPHREPRAAVSRQRFESKFPTPRLLMAFNTVAETDADAIPLDVVSSLLTSGKTSRLHKRLVEEDGAVTSIESTHSAGRYPGYFEVRAELYKTDELPKVEAAVLAEARRLADKGPTEAELRRVRRALTAAHIFAHESVHELADTIARGVVANDLEFVQRYLPALQKVTAADVRRVARRYLVDRKPVAIHSVPKEKAGRGGAAAPKAGPARRGAARHTGANFDLKDARTVVLDNGLKLVLLENHRLPIVVAQDQVGRVKLYEPAGQVGIATLMGSLLEEGTQARSGAEIARSIEDAGGSLEMSACGGTVKVLADDITLGLDLLFDCLVHPSFAADDVQAKREQLLAQLAEEDGQPDQRALRAFRKAVYGDHPFGRPTARPEVIKALTAKDLKAFHRRVFVPNNTVVAVVGDFDADAVAAGVKRRTAAWKAARLPTVAVPDPPKPTGFTQTLITDPAAAQLTVYLGHIGVKRDNPDYYKLLVLDHVLGYGTGFTDRLSRTLRDRQGLAYSVSARIAGSAGEEPGTFLGSIGTFPDKFAEVKAGFLAEIRRIRDEDPEADEVEDVKRYLAGTQAFGLTTCEQAAEMLLTVDRYKLGADYLADYQKAVSAVTPADVRAVARKYLDPDRLVLVAAGPVDAQGKPLPGRKKD